MAGKAVAGCDFSDSIFRARHSEGVGYRFAGKILEYEDISRAGPYKYFRHPNYIIVVCEFAVIPMIFHLYVTAVAFSVLNAMMLRIRIREENRVWGKRDYAVQSGRIRSGESL